MAVSSFDCNLAQAFDFNKDVQDLIGHLTSLKIGETEFTKNIKVKIPTKIGEEEDSTDAVGVIENIYWEGGSKSIYFNCQLTVKNKQEMDLLIHTKLSNTDVKFALAIYDYDPLKGKFFETFHTNKADLNGKVHKNNDQTLEIGLDNKATVIGGSKRTPMTYNFYLGIQPEQESQDIHLAVSQEGKFTKAWGTQVQDS